MERDELFYEKLEWNCNLNQMWWDYEDNDDNDDDEEE